MSDEVAVPVEIDTAEVKRKRLDQRALARNLGSTIRGRVTAASGYFGALQLAREVRLLRRRRRSA